MAKFTSKVFSGVKNIAQPDDSDVDYQPVGIEFPSVNFVAGDIIELVKIPAGVQFADWYAAFPRIDTNGVPTFAFSIGVLNAGSTDLATVYSSGHVAGRATTIERNASTLPYFDDSTVERRVGLKITAVAATYAPPTAHGVIFVALRG